MHIYIYKDCSTNSTVNDSHCSPDLEMLVVKCRPFNLPQEFSVTMITAIHIPPDANAKLALSFVLAAIEKHQNSYPGGVFIIMLPSFDQHAKCATHGDNILDCMYSNVKKGYRAFPLASQGQSDNSSLSLISVYRQLSEP